MQLRTQPVKDLQKIRDVVVPAGVRFREILVTGPPASGKSTLIAGLGGWPEEGFLDLASRWWLHRSLTFRPREVHLRFPLTGHSESVSVIDDAWPGRGAHVDLERIAIPPPKRWWLGLDYRRRFVLDVQLPPPEQLVAIRASGVRGSSHPRDPGLTLEQASSQVDAYAAVALHLHRSGLRVYVREALGGEPRRIEGYEPYDCADGRGPGSD